MNTQINTDGTTAAIRAVLADPCASAWLKNALQTALARDCVDAVNDARILAGLLDTRLVALISAGPLSRK